MRRSRYELSFCAKLEKCIVKIWIACAPRFTSQTEAHVVRTVSSTAWWILLFSKVILVAYRTSMGLKNESIKGPQRNCEGQLRCEPVRWWWKQIFPAETAGSIYRTLDQPRSIFPESLFMMKLKKKILSYLRVIRCCQILSLLLHRAFWRFTAYYTPTNAQIIYYILV